MCLVLNLPTYDAGERDQNKMELTISLYTVILEGYSKKILHIYREIDAQHFYITEWICHNSYFFVQ